MNPEIIISPGARADLAEIHGWYEEKQSGLGSRFLAAVAEVLDFVSRFPRGRPKVHNDVRRANLNVFPYALFYLYEENVIQVLAVQRQSRITQERLEELF